MIAAVVTDIEGTTSSLSIVKDVLAPYARAHLRAYVDANRDSAEVSGALAATRELDGAAGADDARTLDILDRWMGQDRKATPLKRLQGLVWEQGYRDGTLRAHLYGDVVPALRALRAGGCRIYVYSSGSVHAQRLFFQHTGEGDVRELFDGYFDTTSGAKGDPASYRTIAHAIGLDPQRILFLSDTRAELDAARAAGWHALGVARTADLGFAPHPQVTSFADIRLDAFAALDDELVALARACHQRGWVFATSGNFSARVAPGRIAITASGRDKGTLTTVDIVHVDAEGRPIDGRGTPSAETPLHCALYRKLAHIGAVAHTHSVAATVLSRRHREAGAMRLRGYEMAKALTGVHSHETEVTLPIVDNAQDMEVLGARVDRALAAFPTAPAYLVAGHGLTTWAVDVAGARRHLEALEFMLACALAEAG